MTSADVRACQLLSQGKKFLLLVGTYYSQFFSTDLVLVPDCPDQLALATTSNRCYRLNFSYLFKLKMATFVLMLYLIWVLPLLLTATVIISECNIWTRSSDGD